MEYRLNLPSDSGRFKLMSCGDTALLSGVIYTARDAAHKRLVELLEKNEPLPFDLNGATIYYTGPTPAPEGAPIGSAGPTTAGRMDAYTPALLELGLAAMIGKGARSEEVSKAMLRHGAVYFATIGGIGALLAGRIKKCEPIAFPELGTEAVHRLLVEDFPVTLIQGSDGKSLYTEGPKAYLSNI